MPVTIDKFEYADDSEIRQAWISNFGVDTATGGTATASLETKPAADAFDDNAATFWQKNGGATGWIKYDFGEGNSVALDGYSFFRNINPGYSVKNFTLEGSNDNINWTVLDTQTNYYPVLGVTRYFWFARSSAYRYYRINITAVNNVNTLIYEMELLQMLLSIARETTIIKEGSSSAKIVAPQTTSLNKALTRTVTPTINLTDQDNLKIWVRASRTGTNFKLGLHDSGGTTTESNIAISSADTWEEKTIDISAVTNANKDAIDSLILTITNADAENTIYLDAWYGYSEDEGTGGGGGCLVGSSALVGGHILVGHGSLIN